MYSVYDNTGKVLGINRRAETGEHEVEHSPMELKYGVDSAFYMVIDEVFTPKTQAEVSAILAARQAVLDARDLEEGVIQGAVTESGLPGITYAEAQEWLSARYEAITDLASAKEELKRIDDKFLAVIKLILMKIN